ncbi:2-oxoglutarate dehydrogenase E1 component [Geomonas subterranea]|uniref:oxoglutarate dehydrogenase (succinyl-transferring) n=1 Tax=Geomonas subterranea TaxID=2847989 RepID=A0ABX8LF75_9BACT|nr:2-oxoglutarate dehydrogenase E1 component [Geomonas subterranea]QXE89305.1 2-oxoglutarate dehydrogenase E1 component [Geomonas subterranea]QXM08582.1 2-oxoglutarate dehydrogenase E1 component [Geomonas subterranea]
MGILENLTPQWIESQYELWKQNPQQLSEEWRAFFTGFELADARSAGAAPPTGDEALKQSAVQSLIYRYRDIGHLLACTDPLSPCKIEHPLLSLSAFGLEPSDLEQTFVTRRFMRRSAKLKEILQVLRSTYCGSVGVEFMHLQDPDERQWLIDRMEPGGNRGFFTPEQRLMLLKKLKEAALFERELHKRFPGQTRFSLEGGDILIPLLDAAVAKAASLGVTDVVFGMPHRGRLNVLCNIFGMPYENMFAEFADNAEYGVVGEGDVKYHKGFSVDLPVGEGGSVHLTLTSNPSHLEAIDPVVQGKCRARQDRIGEAGETRVLPLLIHGDAAFSGQGVVAETLNLSQLAGYRTGGTLHIVLNNQIGFTTSAADARSSHYATDVAKMVQAPVFHVYGDDAEAVIHVTELAVAYRDRYRKDVVVEVICYRRHGHNEGDEPYFTQPLMYQQIKLRPQLHSLYEMELLGEGFPEEELKAIENEVAQRLSQAGERQAAPVESAFLARWSGMKPGVAKVAVPTSVAADTLLDLSGRLSRIPEGFQPHPKVVGVLQKRHDAITKGGPLDWGNVESLAYASLLSSGVSVRLSGQDVRRGTFSHRHSTLFDQQTGETYLPHCSVLDKGARFCAFDSMLAEFSVLGFEYGYSLEAPDALTIWEAQYGDFVNGAQVIIDQFLVSGEAKWERSSGLVLMLPHGYEGQGAEHSSARIERFLELAAAGNIQAVYPTTPAQLFHVLRRQMLQPFRKPLILFTPKSLLRHPDCVSRLEELSSGSFREVIAEPAVGESVRQVLICSGKIYYDLLGRIRKDQLQGHALLRIEQLYPLPVEQLRDELQRYPAGARFTWVQEEPRNMGAWRFIHESLIELLGGVPRYVGRPDAAAPASGSHRLDRVEQERIVDEALKI